MRKRLYNVFTIHSLYHGNKHIGIHNAICDTFVVIVWETLDFTWDEQNYMHSLNHVEFFLWTSRHVSPKMKVTP
jgi:hypothetical protein